MLYVFVDIDNWGYNLICHLKPKLNYLNEFNLIIWFGIDGETKKKKIIKL